MRRIADRLNDERGASAVLVAILMVVLVGLSGFAIDVAATYSERAQLQNGADSAALAAAKTCANVPASCTKPQLDPALGPIADGNQANSLGGVATSAVLVPPGIQLPSASQPGRVTVSAQTANLPHPFAAVLGITNSPVVAKATAEWGAPNRGDTIALTIAKCEFDDLPPQPADTVNPQRTLLLINNGNTAMPCANGAPGGFGWLDGVNCEATVALNATVGGEVGIQPNPNKNGCSNTHLNTLLCQVVLIPLYDSFTSQGSGTMFHIERFAAFRITGLKTGGAQTATYCGGSTLAPAFPGGGNAKGIQGYFIDYVDFGEDFDLGAAPDGGLMIVRLAPDPS
ncbi:TadE/TadG family type IV pilus assembly protein [Agromyces sp. MMS24-K17]|uniref:TadE/TadG family type IV pilus assembly protein n=1 Tax=Agromyces sp. MMS24-K17 TaxID=3372850 RepID=UPI003753FD4E